MSAEPITRVLSMAEVRRLLTVEDAIELQREAFLALARGRTTAAPNSWLRLPGDQRGWLKLLAAHDDTSGGLGVKVLARFPRNPPGRNLGSLLLLFDDEDGTPLAVMDSVYITAVRTAAGAAVATQALARPRPASMAMLGTGVLAWYTLLAHRHAVSSLTTLRVYSRSAERRETFAARDGKFSDAMAVGAVTEEELGPDLGEVLDGRPGRRSPEEITMFDSSGVAIQDLACAVHVLRAARAAGVGTVVDLAAKDVLESA